MSHIFISYSRKDFDFAQKIVTALADNQLDTWIDWKSIPKGEDWEQEIYRGIEEADAFLFLISPDSVASQMCNKEIEHAVKNGKRILPIVIRDTDPKSIHPEISKRNWVFCRDGQDDFNKAIEETRKTIHTDYEWLKYHTELQVKALKWEQKKDTSRLLRGKELREAEEKLANAGTEKDLQPTDLQRQYILASRRDETLQQQHELEITRNLANEQRKRAEVQTKAARRLRVFLVTVLALLIAAVFFAFQSRWQAQLARSGETIAYSQAIRVSNPRLSLLLAVEAMRLSTSSFSGPTAASEDNLMEALTVTRGHISHAVLRGHNSSVTDVAFSPDGNWIVTAGYDNIARLWDFRSFELTSAPIALQGHTGGINEIAISNDGHWLATASADNTVRVWDLLVADPANSSNLLSGFDWDVRHVAFSPDNHLLISASRSIRVWDMTAGSLAESSIKFPQEYMFGVEETAVSPDSRWLLVSCSGNPAVGASHECPFDLWDLTTSKSKPKSYLVHNTGFLNDQASYAAAFSPDGEWLLIANGLIPLSQPDATPFALTGDSTVMSKAMFSPNSQWLVAIPDQHYKANKIAYLWNMSKLDSMPFELHGHKSWIEDITISSDNHWIITASQDKTIRLWDLTTADPSVAPFTLGEHTGSINAVAINPDGRYVLTGSSDGTARLQSLAPSELISSRESACRTAGRNLTYVEWKQYLGSLKYQKTCEQWPLEIVPEVSFWDSFKLDFLSEFTATCFAGGCEGISNCLFIMLILPFVGLYYWIRGLWKNR